MEIVVISNPTDIPNEANLINELFDAGLHYFHLRKPAGTQKEITHLLTQIKSDYLSHISLHQHHEIAKEFNIKRLHFNESERTQLTNEELNDLRTLNYCISTSVHSTDDFELLNENFNYAFIGPVYDSISKKDYKASSEICSFKSLKKELPLPFAIGGITANKIHEIREKGFKGVGLLGTIWQEPENALKNFISIKTNSII